KELSDRIDAKPQAVHAVIAHSHGGNIAHNAAADPRIANRLGKLVCMSTPFFRPRERDVVTAARNLAIAFLCFFGVITLISVLVYRLPGFAALARRFDLFRNADALAPWAIAATLALLLAMILWLSRKRAAAWVARRQREKIDEIAVPSSGSAPVLYIWAKGDEILLLFRALDRLADLTLVLLRLKSIAVVFVLMAVWLSLAGNQAIFKILNFGMTVFTLVVLPFYPFAVLWEYFANRAGIHVLAGLPFAIVIMTVLTITILSVASFFAAAILHWFLKLAPFGMTGWRFLDTFLLRIAPSPTPRDRSSVMAEEMRLSRWPLLRSVTGRRMHSAVYGGESALQRIAAFIRSGPQRSA
ncbi:MAG: hypothetical protein QOH67_3196, partial [Hyphomicrobiales bacterium]|nr:hypothetical protein [Hyphomicrobiales bacterium]